MKKTTINITLLSLLLVPCFAFAEEITLSTGTSSHATSTSTSISASTTTSTDTSTTTPVVKPFTICSQEAIERRDTNIASSRSTYNVAMTHALTERKNREKAAIAIEDEDDRKDAIRSSVETYKNQTKAAQNTLTLTRKTLWQTFENDIKDCRLAEENVITTKEAASEEKVSKMVATKKIEEPEVKSIKETIMDKIGNFFSLFNN